MKKHMLAVLALLSFVVTSVVGIPSAFAVGSGAAPVRVIYQTSPVLTWAYSTLVASSVKGIRAIQVNNTGAHAVELAVGASSNEVPQLIVGGGQDSVVLPVDLGYASRLSVVALDGPNETGELEVNVIYN